MIPMSSLPTGFTLSEQEPRAFTPSFKLMRFTEQSVTRTRREEPSDPETHFIHCQNTSSSVTSYQCISSAVAHAAKAPSDGQSAPCPVLGN